MILFCKLNGQSLKACVNFFLKHLVEFMNMGIFDLIKKYVQCQI